MNVLLVRASELRVGDRIIGEQHKVGITRRTDLIERVFVNDKFVILNDWATGDRLKARQFVMIGREEERRDHRFESGGRSSASMPCPGPPCCTCGGVS